MSNSKIIRRNAVAELMEATLSDGSKVYDLVLCKAEIPCDDHEQATAFMNALEEMAARASDIDDSYKKGRIQLEQRFCNRCDRKTHHVKIDSASWVCEICSL